jgi:hypothetical protein
VHIATCTAGTPIDAYAHVRHLFLDGAFVLVTFVPVHNIEPTVAQSEQQLNAPSKPKWQLVRNIVAARQQTTVGAGTYARFR